MRKCNTTTGKLRALILITVLFFVGSLAIQAQGTSPAERIFVDESSINEFIGFALIIGSLIGVNELLRKENHH